MEWRSISLHGTTQEDGWIPALEDLRAWQTGAVEIYKPAEPVFITRPDNKHWPILTRDEEADILALLYEPWISRDHVLALSGEPTTITAAARDHVLALSGEPTTITAAARDHVLALSGEPATITATARDHVLALSGEPTTITAAARDHVLALSGEPTTITAPQQQQQPFPRHLIAPLLTHAVATSALCPITLEPITLTNASITSCGHIFQTAALTEWFRLGATTCPECRSPCVV